MHVGKHSKDEKDVTDWTCLGINEASQLTRDKDQRRKCVYRVANRPLEDDLI